MKPLELKRKTQQDAWTQQEKDTLRSMAGKATASEIAAHLGRTVGAVRIMAFRLRTPLGTMKPRRGWTAQELKTLRDLAPAHTVDQVAQALGRTRGSVKWAAHFYGVSFTKHGEAHHETKFSTETIRMIVEMRERGDSYQQIVDLTGVSSRYVWEIANYNSRWRETMAMGD